MLPRLYNKLYILEQSLTLSTTCPDFPNPFELRGRAAVMAVRIKQLKSMVLKGQPCLPRSLKADRRPPADSPQ